jgi:hypothetical protein
MDFTWLNLKKCTTSSLEDLNKTDEVCASDVDIDEVLSNSRIVVVIMQQYYNASYFDGNPI